MTSKDKPIVFFAVICVCFYILLMIKSHEAKKLYLKYQFNGIIKSVTYDVKGKATILVNNVPYELFDNDWDFDHNRIEKNDSIVKAKNSMIIKLIKRNGKIIFEGYN